MELLKDKQLRWFEEVWNKRQLGSLADFFREDSVVNKFGAEAVDVRGIEAIKTAMQRTLELLPDIHFKVEQILVDGELTATRWISTGSLNGTPIEVEGMTTAIWRDGKMIFGWNCFGNSLPEV